MSNPASFVTAASVDDTNTFTAAQTFAAHVYPGTANTYDLGALAPGLTWRRLYLAGYLVAPSVGANATQQHTLPAVASDTVALLAASQAFTNKTLTAPAINGTVTTTGLTMPTFGMGGNDLTNAGALNCDAVQGRILNVSVRPFLAGLGQLQNGASVPRFSWNDTGVAFFGATPQAQSAAIADAAGGATVDGEARAAINALLAYLRLRGDVAI